MRWRRLRDLWEELKGMAHATWRRLIDDFGAVANRPFARALSFLGLGAGLMYSFDPNEGRRRRAVMSDQFVHAVRAFDRMVGSTSRGIRNQVRGLRARAWLLPKTLLEGHVSDEKLAERVRSKIDRSISHPASIDVTARQGHVALQGPIVREEAGDLLAAVLSVAGVRDLEDRLEVYEDHEAMAQPDGDTGHARRKRAMSTPEWSPTACLLVGSAGGALLLAGARRHGLGRLGLATLGIGLLTCSIVNIPAARSLHSQVSPSARKTRRKEPMAAALPHAGVEGHSPGDISMEAPLP
jgi:hypothetical protein